MTTTPPPRWTKKIANPVGYPDNPPEDICWIWVGYFNRQKERERFDYVLNRTGSGLKYFHKTHKAQSTPRARLNTQLVNPKRVLFEHYHKHLPPGLTSTCKNEGCVNPRHHQTTLRTPEVTEQVAQAFPETPED